MNSCECSFSVASKVVTVFDYSLFQTTSSDQKSDPVVEFKSLARRDAFERMDSELKILLETAPEDKKEVMSLWTVFVGLLVLQTTFKVLNLNTAVQFRGSVNTDTGLSRLNM